MNMADWVGQQLGNYQLLRLLGEGGFAEVYLGEHVHLGTQAAIKVLHTQLISNDIDKFRTEARTIAHLIHPHIVRVLEFGVEGKTPFLVMDYAPHGTLRQQYPKGTRLPLDIIIHHVKQVADALQYAHDEQLIHRDIKPENMLVGRRNEVLLSDFGIALVAQSSRYQNPQEMAGTMAYMAPEQIQGKPRPASDQYSLGIVVYEWLSGDRPFHGSLTELVGQHLSAFPPSLHEKVPVVPPPVEQVVLTALAKNPKERFASVQEFSAALQQACQLAPSHSTALPAENPTPSQNPTTNTITTMLANDSPPPMDVVTPIDPSSLPKNEVDLSRRSRQARTAALPSHTFDASASSLRGYPQFGRPHPSKQGISRRTVVLGLGIVGLAVAGGGLTWWVTSQEYRSPNLINTLTPTPEKPPGTTLEIYHDPDVVSSVAWSPNGKYIASGSKGTVHVWEAATNRRILEYLGHKNRLVNTVSWSPDGKYIASGSEEGSAHIWEAATGKRIFEYKDLYGKNGFASFAWSPNGKYIALGSHYGYFFGTDPLPTLRVWEVAAGKTITISEYKVYTIVISVAWSPNGKYIASGIFIWADSGPKGTVQVWEVATSKLITEYRGHSSAISSVAWPPNGKYIVSGSYDYTAHVWEVATLKPITKYTGHSSAIYSVAWSPNGKYIVSGSYDNTAQVWEVATGNLVTEYRGHSSAISSVAWSPNGKYIASGSSGKTVRVWVAVRAF